MKRTFAAPRNPKCGKCPDNTKDILCVDRRDVALRGIWAMDRELRPRRGHDLLLLCACKLTEYRLRHSRRRLDRQGVHEHVRSGCHGGQLAIVLECEHFAEAFRRVTG